MHVLTVHCEYTDLCAYLEGMRQSLLHRLAPGLLVVMWSSGFVGAALAAPVAPSTTTLLWRYVVAAPVMVVIVLALRRRYRWRYVRREVVLGVLGQAGYLYGVFRAVEEGLPAGTAALLASLQPALVAVVLAATGRGGSGLRQTLGLAVGFAGVALAVGPDAVAGTGIAGALWALGGMLSLSAATLLGTLWPAPSAPDGHEHDVLDSLAVQSVVTLVLFAVVAFAAGEAAPPAEPRFWLAVVWLVVLAFAGGYGLYLYVLRTRGPVAVSTWLYLTPAVSAVWAWAMFGEALPLLTIAGFAVSLTGVLLARPSGPRGATPSSGPADDDDRPAPPPRSPGRPASRPARAAR
ncbi:Permease of the drug/metabolite transporter (DMT) superfamily [Promicromonospora thailandica]|uniref:Permease of the drug/metabolite transporter (DMT) superfamily n=1 Tax=Promicromonospora thailandica TaxID=765201 RepID=A0A9X2JUM3_9MICO|nr:Permease of the drug/metabolite transporter (DMT) superfamily [Promicromonospora thailandica]BFF21165.1 DMT family transporter [Promicromonospora thailandica]